MKHSLIALAVVILAVTGQVTGQTDVKSERREVRKARDRHLGFGIGTAYIRVMDQATSPLIYKGTQLVNARLDYQVHSSEIIKTLETDFSFGYLNTRTETPWYNPSNTSYFVAIRYNWLWNIVNFAGERVHFYLGPEANINGHFRVNYKYGNSAFTFDNYYGIGPAARFEIPFSWKSRDVHFWFLNFKRRDRDLRFSWQLSTPVVSYLIRPTFVTVTNFIDPALQRAISPDQTTGGFFTPLNIRSQAELCYALHNRNMLKLSYTWNFFNHDPGYNKVQSAYHGFIFSFVFKFNPNR